MPSMSRASCPWCGRSAAVRAGGRFSVHNDLDRAASRFAGAVRCAGVGRGASEHDPTVDRPRAWPVRPFATVPREWLWRRDRGVCWICGAKNRLRGDWHADHLIPLTAPEDAAQRAGLDRHPGDSWTNQAVTCLGCNMDKGARFGQREIDKHRELAKRYPEGFCVTLRVASCIWDPVHVPVIDIYWEACLECNRAEPNRAKCPDCAERIAHITVDRSEMTTHLR